MFTRRDLAVAAVAVCAALGGFALAQTKSAPMGSSAFDWNAVEAKPEKYGSRRQFFQSPTATLDRLECHVTTINPGEATGEPHRHPEEALVIVKEGTVEALVNGEWRRVGPGSVIFEASNQLHGIRNAGKTPATYHVVKWVSTATPQAAPPAATVDEVGFELIFDGKTLRGWEGDSKYWRVRDGALVGEVTPETALKQNSFLIWRGGAVRDFELKVEYRVSARGNSGINYRSVEVEGQPFALRGYQADIDGHERNAGGLRHTGQNYEERGRTFLARRGQTARLAEGKEPALVASVGDAKELAAFIKNDDWNEYHLIARSNVLIHNLNGRVMSVVVDDDAKNRRGDGLLGVQVHTGPPMKIEYRNFRLKKL